MAMSDAAEMSARIAQALRPAGLIQRGAFHPTPDDEVPGDAGTLFLVGNAGPAMWRAYAAGRTAGQTLDDWTAAAVGATAAALGARALFPFGGPPFLPFQRWARRAEAVHASPIGILIHPRYGLWHAYRGALAISDRLALPRAGPRPDSPCDSCAEKPCLTACPVDALAPGTYDTEACAAHVRGAAGGDCRATGCRARRACPVGRDYVYAPDQAAFHMAAFLRARQEA